MLLTRDCARPYFAHVQGTEHRMMFAHALAGLLMTELRSLALRGRGKTKGAQLQLLRNLQCMQSLQRSDVPFVEGRCALLVLVTPCDVRQHLASDALMHLEHAAYLLDASCHVFVRPDHCSEALATIHITVQTSEQTTHLKMGGIEVLLPNGPHFLFPSLRSLEQACGPTVAQQLSDALAGMQQLTGLRLGGEAAEAVLGTALGTLSSLQVKCGSGDDRM